MIQQCCHVKLLLFFSFSYFVAALFVVWTNSRCQFKLLCEVISMKLSLVPQALDVFSINFFEGKKP